MAVVSPLRVPKQNAETNDRTEGAHGFLPYEFKLPWREYPVSRLLAMRGGEGVYGACLNVVATHEPVKEGLDCAAEVQLLAWAVDEGIRYLEDV